MNKRGTEITIKEIIFATVGVLVFAGVLFASVTQYDKAIDWAKAFNFNGSVEPLKADDGFLRYHLLEDTLEFSEDGNNWNSLAEDRKIEIQGKDYSFGLVKAQVEGFYFGKSVREDFEYDVIVADGNEGEYNVNVKMNSVLEQDNQLGRVIVSVSRSDDLLSSVNFINYYGDKSISLYQGYSQPPEVSIGSSSPEFSRLVSNALTWRDSILKGNSNQQPATIGEGKYYVEKLGDYLVVRLNEPVR